MPYPFDQLLWDEESGVQGAIPRPRAIFIPWTLTLKANSLQFCQKQIEIKIDDNKKLGIFTFVRVWL